MQLDQNIFKLYKGPALKAAEIVATPSTPKYRNDPKSRKEDVQKIPGLNVHTVSKFPLSVQKEFMKYRVSERPDHETLKAFVNAAPTIIGPLPFGELVGQTLVQGSKLAVRGINNIVKLPETLKARKIVKSLQDTDNLNNLINDLEFLSDPQSPFSSVLHPELKNEFNKFKELDASMRKAEDKIPWGVSARLGDDGKILVDTHSTDAPTREEIRALRKQLTQQTIQRYGLPIGRELAHGNFGTVYTVPKTKFVLKIGRGPGFETANSYKLLEKVGKQLNDPQVALPIKSVPLGDNHVIQLLPRVSGVSIDGMTSIPQESLDQVSKLIFELRDKGVFTDAVNPDNYRYNTRTKKINLIDLNSTPPAKSRFNDYNKVYMNRSDIRN